MSVSAEDSLEPLRQDLSSLQDRPITDHVSVLGRSLDALVSELDDLARSIPPAR